MSNELKQFYRELWAWVQDGCPEDPIFNECRDLRDSINEWISHNQYKKPSRIAKLKAGNEGLLKEAFPFNYSGYEWKYEKTSKSLYENPKRLAFIEEHAE